MSLFLQPFGLALTEGIYPIKEAVSNPSEMEAFLIDLGWNIEIDNNIIINIGNAFQALTDLVDDALGLMNDIKVENGSELQNTIDLAQKIRDFFDAVKSYDGSSTAGLPTPIDQPFFWQSIADRIPSYLVARYLRERQPFFYGFFLSIGVIETTEQAPAGSFFNYQVHFTDYRIDISRLGDFFTDAPGLLKSFYNWNDPNNAFDHKKLLFNLEQFAIGMNLLVDRSRPLPALYLNSNFFSDTQVDLQEIQALSIPIISGSNVASTDRLEVGASLMPIPRTPGPNAVPEGLYFTPIAQGQLGPIIPLTPELTLLLNAQFQGTGVFGIKIFPEGAELDTNISNGLISAALKLNGTPRNPEKPWILLGAAGESRIELEGFEAGVEVNGTANEIESSVKLGTKEGLKIRFILEPGYGDGFINKIFQDSLEIDWEGFVQWSSISGFGINGHLGFEYELPIHKTIGPFIFESIVIRFVSKAGGAGLTFSLNAGLKFGPFSAVVNEIGAELLVKKKAPNESQGVLGNIDLDFGFKPPTGLGLSIKNDTISGAGYLSFNQDEARYTGFLELRIKGTIHIKVFGILTTKLPGGKQGYSLLLLILVDDFKPIPLGFGFTLNGFGGLIALHRRMNSDYLLSSARDGRLKDILSPENPIQNINSIIDTLENSFPIEEERFTFGPLLKIGWGSPTLITIDVGVFMEFPDPEEVVIIGLISAILPSKDNPIIQLQIAFAGVINFEQKSISINASIINSRLLTYTLEGDMAFRMRWGENPIFVLSVGGFHPDFHPPAELRIGELKRMTINLLTGDNPRLTLTAYFAITSNSIQFGSKIDFYFAAGNFDVVGYIGFDALIYFNPFYFRVGIPAELSVRFDGESLLTITLTGTLEGPSQWHVQGNFKFKIWGIECDKNFDISWGDPAYTSLPDVQVMPKLITALQDTTNWQATQITNVPLLVTLRELVANPGDVVIHPHTVIAVKQKVVPLKTRISRFGNAKPEAINEFKVDLSLGSSTATYEASVELKEYFSPNEFFELNEGERLSRASFEQLPAGLQISSTSNALTTGGSREMKYLYETIVMDSRNFPIHLPIETPLQPQTQDIFKDGNAASKSSFGADLFVSGDFAPPPVVNAGRSFSVANTGTLVQVGNTSRTQVEAQQELERLIVLNPALEGSLQIVNSFEL